MTLTDEENAELEQIRMIAERAALTKAVADLRLENLNLRHQLRVKSQSPPQEPADGDSVDTNPALQ